MTPLPQVESESVHAQAQALLETARAGQAQPLLLKGRKLGLLCEDAQHGQAQLFERAAGALGAHVAHLRPSLCRLDTPSQVQHTARMLGRLYDAVECQGMAPGLVRQIGLWAGVPVFHHLAGQAGAPQNDADTDADTDPRHFLLQALLLQALT